ncbi:hypothetical protein JOB18_046997 [Solea senegalensis]|uniref:Uncharacterized protein n=1 Tax=Solea senegalensis TaxID=28829 RepID=A0AAV6S4G4_SOLSE|nr:hypothetical protein JOB18_046997 [Solea senegalensis]
MAISCSQVTLNGGQHTVGTTPATEERNRVMAGVPSCFEGLSATQRDDEDTIQDTLGRTLKTPR